MEENELLAKIENELRTGTYDEALWEKALIDNEGNRAKAEEEYVNIRMAQLTGESYADDESAIAATQVSESHPSRAPVKSRNIFIGVSLVILLIVLVVLVGFLLHDYFNVR